MTAALAAALTPTHKHKHPMTVKVITESGDTWTTTINATEEEARAYFVGKWFNVGSGENDRMENVASIETIKANP